MPSDPTRRQVWTQHAGSGTLAAEQAETQASSSQLSLLEAPTSGVSPSSAPVPFHFADVFAGIGGFRLALSRLGGTCVFASEVDRHCQKTYHSWFGAVPTGDIRNVDPSSIPPHDILAAGFPCQPFSIAGVSKRKSLGRAHGFEDAVQGALFSHVANIIRKLRPPILLLENVKHLLSHNGGRTWRVIRTTLQVLGYHVHADVLDAVAFVPQHRERVFIVGFKKAEFGSGVRFHFPRLTELRERPTLKDILESNVDPKYTLSDQLWGYLQDYANKHRRRGNGFGFGLPSLDGASRTLSARYHKDGSEILIRQDGKNPRRLTPRECARLMGFPDHLEIVVSDTQAYRQFGNAVSPPLVEAVGSEILRSVLAHRSEQQGSLASRPALN